MGGGVEDAQAVGKESAMAETCALVTAESKSYKRVRSSHDGEMQ